jgi:UDP-2,3-diacylglucosamine pyrophosphatase LpxH
MHEITFRNALVESPPIATRRNVVETLFLSDCHLGARHARSADLLRFLESIEPNRIYLVGDIVDGWALRRRWRWTRIETECLRRLLGWARQGVPLYYAAGNHDNFLHPFLDDFGLARLDREFQHTAANGKRYLIVHGDRFDDELGTPGWKTWVGSVGYDALFWWGAKVNQLRAKFGLSPSDFAQRWRNAIPAARNHLSNWERASAQRAQMLHCDGVICGHVHTPRVRWIDGVEYINIGDWMENRVALIETTEGNLCHWSEPSVLETPRIALEKISARIPRATAVSSLEAAG